MLLLERLFINDQLWLDVVGQHHTSIAERDALAQPGADRPAHRVLGTIDRYAAMISPQNPAPGAAPPVGARHRGTKKVDQRDEVSYTLVRGPVGLCPPGTFVKLDNGETAIVLRRSDKGLTTRWWPVCWTRPATTAASQPVPDRLKRQAPHPVGLGPVRREPGAEPPYHGAAGTVCRAAQRGAARAGDGARRALTQGTRPNRARGYISASLRLCFRLCLGALFTLDRFRLFAAQARFRARNQALDVFGAARPATAP